MMNKKNILVVFGGCSSEYAVSLSSAAGVLGRMDQTALRPIPVGITREGAWRLYRGPAEALPEDRWRENSVPCALRLDRGRFAVLTETEEPIPIHAAFPVLHGQNGEDGTIQGLLELAGVPLIGCGTLSSALCMDKHLAHQLAAQAGVRAPKGVLLSAAAPLEQAFAAAERLGYPLFVKPLRAGSSFGVSRAAAPENLAPAIREALQYDREYLLEEAVPGFEVGCAVLGNDTLTTGLVDEIEIAGGLFDYEEKYTLKTSAIHCPARIPPETAAAVQEAAKTVYRALRCRCFARVDFFLTPAGDIVFNEVNTIPGFTAHSRYPNMMKGAGLDFDALIARLVELGAES